MHVQLDRLLTLHGRNFINVNVIDLIKWMDAICYNIVEMGKNT